MVTQLYAVIIYNPIWCHPKEDGGFPFEFSEGFFLMSHLENFLATLFSGLLIKDLNLHSDICKASS